MKALVLLSAGLDSTVNLYKAKAELSDLKAINFDYGQKAADAERRQAQVICNKLDIELLTIDLNFFSEHLNTSSLTNANIAVSLNVDIKDHAASVDSAKNVWVPNRNGILLNIAAGVAESIGYDCVIPGFNIEEASTFPDNSDEYLQAVEKSLFFSTANQIKTKCYTTFMTKKEIVQLGKDLQVDFDLLWPCYQNLAQLCGECESCLRFQRAMGSC